MLDRQKIRDEISDAARVRWDRLNELGTCGLVAGECADIAVKVLDAHGVFEQTAPDRAAIEAARDGLRTWLDGREGNDQLGRDVSTVLDALEQQTTELYVLRGTELNPSQLILDAESYRYLCDEIAATMTDDWDGDDAESYTLARYIRWLAAGQPRDEDGHPVRRESYPPCDLVAKHAELRQVEQERGEDDVAAAIEMLRNAARDPNRCRNRRDLHVCARLPHTGGDHLDVQGWSWADESADLAARDEQEAGR